MLADQGLGLSSRAHNSIDQRLSLRLRAGNRLFDEGMDPRVNQFHSDRYVPRSVNM